MTLPSPSFAQSIRKIKLSLVLGCTWRCGSHKRKGPGLLRGLSLLLLPLYQAEGINRHSATRLFTRRYVEMGLDKSFPQRASGGEALVRQEHAKSCAGGSLPLPASNEKTATMTVNYLTANPEAEAG